MHTLNIPGRLGSGKAQWAIQQALDAQASKRRVRCVVRNLDELDFLVSRGVKPSNIRLMTELKPRQEWHQAHVGIFYDVL